ncbi:rhomboid family intramembrane serine protease [Myxococcota bacterium]|nr:rhomboid family intramembrane serine protease [Myxococcota bacterium]
MGDGPLLRMLNETSPVDLDQLDDQLRQGLIPGDALLRHAPWTGERFVPLSEIPQLADALAAPDALLAAYMRRRPFPVVSTALTAVIFLTGILQIAVTYAAAGPDDLSTKLARLYLEGRTGLEPLLFDGAWWAPWASQLVHAGPVHLLPNIAVLGYSGFRVERALGGAGYAVIAAASVAGANLAVVLGQNEAVIGSSMLAFGLLCAQIAIGFRLGDGLPADQRRYYGFGNLLLFVLLFTSTLRGENTSHLAHIGGLVGGAIAALLVQPPILSPPSRRAQTHRRALLWTAALALLPSFYGPVLRAIPSVGLWPAQTVTVQEVGVTIDVPGRLLPEREGDVARGYRSTTFGMPAWTLSPTGRDFVFVGVQRLEWAQVRDGDPLVGEALAERWRALSPGGTLVPAEAPPPKGPGWTPHSLNVVDPEGIVRYRLIEHHLLRGRFLTRAGYLVSVEDDGALNPRAEVFERMLASVKVGDPPALAAARASHAELPSSPTRQLALADALADSGDLQQADALYALVITGGSPSAWDAADRRLRLWAERPELFDDPEDPAWFERQMEDRPDDRDLQEAGVRFLAAKGRCAAARFHHERNAVEGPLSASALRTAAWVLACERGDVAPPSE